MKTKDNDRNNIGYFLSDVGIVFNNLYTIRFISIAYLYTVWLFLSSCSFCPSYDNMTICCHHMQLSHLSIVSNRCFQSVIMIFGDQMQCHAEIRSNSHLQLLKINSYLYTCICIHIYRCALHIILDIVERQRLAEIVH